MPAAFSRHWAKTSGPSTQEALNICRMLSFGFPHKSNLTSMSDPYAEPLSTVYTAPSLRLSPPITNQSWGVFFQPTVFAPLVGPGESAFECTELARSWGPEGLLYLPRTHSPYLCCLYLWNSREDGLQSPELQPAAPRKHTVTPATPSCLWQSSPGAG